MLKKICPKCEKICGINSNYCDDCGNELYYYLILNSILGKIISLFSKNNLEELILDELKQLEKWESFFNIYQNNSETPNNVFFEKINEFKKEKSNFKYLNRLHIDDTHYNSLLSEYVIVSKYIGNVEKEISQLGSLPSKCSNFSMEFERLYDNFKEYDNFLSKYSKLESEINNLKYLDIAPKLDSSSKTSIDKIIEAKNIFDDFDNRLSDIIAKHDELERILSFNNDYVEFNNSWNEFLSDFRTDNDKKLFLENSSNLKNTINSFTFYDTENKDYKKAIADAKDIIFKLNNIDKFLKVTNANIKFSKLCNICKKSYIDSNYKDELFYNYFPIFDDFDELKIISKCIGIDLIHENNLNLASNDFDKFIKDKNDEFVERELDEYDSFFNNIDGKSLDEHQRKVVVIDETNMQIIAGAGCGKTLTICGKVKYLMDKGVKPDEILCLSYSKASANDLVKKLPEGVKASTFHSLGKGILEEDLGNKVTIRDKLLDYVINNFLVNVVFEDEDLLKKLTDYFSYYSYDVVDRENKNMGEILEIEEGRSFKTLRQRYSQNEEKKTFKYETVKSFEELLIANYLFIHGINYEYEKKYVAKEGNMNRSWSNYKPDFYLTDYDIYLEHFGVNRNLDAPWLDDEHSDKYKQSIYDKRKLHEKHDTKLIETYSYFVSENVLMSKLDEILEKNGVKIKDVDYKKILEELSKNDKLNSFKSLTNLVESFINLFKGKNYDSSKFDEFKKQAENENLPFIKQRHLLFLDIVEEIYRRYEKELENLDVIDFNDMINRAIDVIRENKVSRNYKYIIVDEYQDISYMRFKLLNEIQNVSNAKIFVVGDDWQSIYRFTGCDVSLFTRFGIHFSNAEKCYIKNTYRNSQSLIDIAGGFIKKNPDQIDKNLNSKQEADIKNPIKVAYYKNYDNKSKIKALEVCVKNIANTSKNILILGRYKFSINHYLKTKKTPESPFKKGRDKKIIYEKDPSLNINFLTAHSSKGLEADNVILLDLENTYLGFPSKKEDDAVLKYVIDKGDQFELAEERRLFYVAITRTKKYDYFLVNYDKPSQFVKELEDFTEFDVLTEIECNPEKDKVVRTKLKCPICKTGDVSIKKLKGGYRKFVCSHRGCYWDGGFYNGKFNDLDIMENCPECDGILYVRYSKNGPFAACSKYNGSRCAGTKELNGKFDHLKEEYKEQQEILGKCPECGGNLIEKYSFRYKRSFVSCANFPDCRYSCDLDKLKN